MAESSLWTYWYGIMLGFMIGFFFLYVTHDWIITEDTPSDMFGLGVMIMIALLFGYVIYVDGRKK